MRLIIAISILLSLSSTLFSQSYNVKNELQKRKQSKMLKVDIDAKEYDKIEKMLKNGYDLSTSYNIDFRKNFYPKVINYAFATSDVKTVQILLKYAKLEKEKLNILLRDAIINNNFKVATYMINNKIDINYTNEKNIYNLLQYALLQRKNKKTIKYLIENGANVNYIAISKDNLNKGDISTLLIASNNENIFDFLVKKGADIKGLNGFIALRNRVDTMDLKRVLFLLDKNVNINFQDKNGNTILHLIANKTPENQIKQLKEMLNKKDPSLSRFYYMSLENSIQRLEHNYKNYNKVVKSILKLNPNLNLKNKNGKTPQDIAKENANTKFLNAISN